MTPQQYFDRTVQGKQPSAQHVDPKFVFGMFRNFDHNKQAGRDWVEPTREFGLIHGLNTDLLP